MIRAQGAGLIVCFAHSTVQFPNILNNQLPKTGKQPVLLDPVFIKRW